MLISRLFQGATRIASCKVRERRRTDLRWMLYHSGNTWRTSTVTLPHANPVGKQLRRVGPDREDKRVNANLPISFLEDRLGLSSIGFT